MKHHREIDPLLGSLSLPATGLISNVPYLISITITSISELVLSAEVEFTRRDVTFTKRDLPLSGYFLSEFVREVEAWETNNSGAARLLNFDESFRISFQLDPADGNASRVLLDCNVHMVSMGDERVREEVRCHLTGLASERLQLMAFAGQIREFLRIHSVDTRNPWQS